MGQVMRSGPADWREACTAPIGKEHATACRIQRHRAAALAATTHLPSTTLRLPPSQLWLKKRPRFPRCVASMFSRIAAVPLGSHSRSTCMCTGQQRGPWGRPEKQPQSGMPNGARLPPLLVPAQRGDTPAGRMRGRTQPAANFLNCRWAALTSSAWPLPAASYSASRFCASVFVTYSPAYCIAAGKANRLMTKAWMAACSCMRYAGSLAGNRHRAGRCMM